jgi:hypothetical protein
MHDEQAKRRTGERCNGAHRDPCFAESLPRHVEVDYAYDISKIAIASRLITTNTQPANRGGIQQLLETAHSRIPPSQHGEAHANSSGLLCPLRRPCSR